MKKFCEKYIKNVVLKINMEIKQKITIINIGTQKDMLFLNVTVSAGLFEKFWLLWFWLYGSLKCTLSIII